MELTDREKKVLRDNLDKKAFRETLFKLLDEDIDNLVGKMLADSKNDYDGEVKGLLTYKGGCKALNNFKHKLNTYVQDQT